VGRVLTHLMSAKGLKSSSGYRTSFVIASVRLAYIEINELRGNLFLAHSLEQSYHPTQPFKQEKCNTKLKNV
jgi:shikimate kinase